MGKVVVMTRATLSMEQAKQLWFQECMAICGSDSISVSRAKAILDDDSVEYALNKSKGGSWWNVFGYGTFGKGITYLTWKGFIEAVGWYNVEQEYLKEVCNDDSDTGQGNERKHSNRKGTKVQ